jgi:hypothetical protein
MSTLAMDIFELVDQLKNAVLKLENQDLPVKISGFSILLKVILTEAVNAEGNNEFVLAKHSNSKSHVQTLYLHFTEKTKAKMLRKSANLKLEDSLERAVQALSIAVKHMAKGLERFEMDSGQVNLNFSAASDNSISFYGVGTAIKSENISSVEIELRRK